MGTFGNILCKGVGIAGMSAVLYDAYNVGKFNSKRASMAMEADHFEKIHADTRTLSTESYINNAMQKRIADWRMNTPVYSLVGTVKGAINGFMHSLGDNIIPVSFASLALAGKGAFAKVGAWGTGLYALLMVLKEGFGITKKNPMS